MSNENILHAESNELEIIVFYIDEELPDGGTYRSFFGMNVAKVLSIIRRPSVTGVPGKHHPAALGTFNLRGQVLPLVDLSLWLGKKTSIDDSWKVIVAEFSSTTTAFLVSGVTRIHRMTWAQVEPPGKYLQDFSHDSITGVIRLEERIVFLLDMEHILGSMNPSLSLAAHATQEGPNVDGKGYKILLADDSASIRHIIGKELKQHGFDVTFAACGSEAWEKLLAYKANALTGKETLDHSVHLVISDIEMPEMDGHALTRRIKEDPELKKIPVILFSSLISDVVKQKGIAAGADDQVSKPDLPGLALRSMTLIKKYSSH